MIYNFFFSISISSILEVVAIASMYVVSDVGSVRVTQIGFFISFLAVFRGAAVFIGCGSGFESLYESMSGFEILAHCAIWSGSVRPIVNGNGRLNGFETVLHHDHHLP